MTSDIRLELLVSVIALLACGPAPDQARSPLFGALSLQSPAGQLRTCERFLAGPQSSAPVDHWECFRRSGGDWFQEPGPWTEERVSVSRGGVVHEVRRRWIMADTAVWLSLADSIGLSLQRRGAQEVRCELGVYGVRAWFLDSAFVVLEAVPWSKKEVPAGRPSARPRLELMLRAKHQGGPTCIPLIALPNRRRQLAALQV
jgi:hypothetical protein